MKLLGAVYLLWLAVSSAGSAVKPQPLASAGVSQGRWFLQGLLLNLTNPKAVFAWMAALAVGLDPTDGALPVAVATLLCACVGLLNYLGWALVFSTDSAMAGYARLRRAIDGLVAAFFAVAGVGLIRSVVNRQY